MCDAIALIHELPPEVLKFLPNMRIVSSAHSETDERERKASAGGDGGGEVRERTEREDGER